MYGFNENAGFAETDAVVFHSGSRLRWCYAVTKLADESFGYAYAQKYGLNIIIARLFNTIGPRQVAQYGMVVPSFVRQAINNQPVTVYGDGTQTRSFCDVRDIVKALDLLAATPAAKGEIVNVGMIRKSLSRIWHSSLCNGLKARHRYSFSATGKHMVSISRMSPIADRY